MSTISGLVGTTSTSTSIVDSLIGSSSSSSASVVDYNLIKNGAYGKLMKAYYAEQSSATSKEEETSLKTTKSASEDLAKSTSALMKSSFEDDDREKLLESLKSWVEDYNSVVESTDDVDDTSTLRQVLWMTQNTEANEGLLGKIGITVKADNTLSIDEDKFNEADLSTAKTLFSGTGSYGSQIVKYATGTYSAASSALNNISSESA